MLFCKQTEERKMGEAFRCSLYYRCSCNMQLQECQPSEPVRNQLTLLTQKKTFLKVLGVVLFSRSAHIRTKQRKARRGPGNRVRASPSLHFRRQFVYPRFVY